MTPRFAVVTVSTPAIWNFALSTESTKQAYCEKHGYAFCRFRSSLDRSRHPSWSKVPALLDSFEKVRADWYLWTDADALILNSTVTLDTLIDPEADLLITQDENGINAGNFLIRRSDRTEAFLRAVNDRTQFIDHPWWEQAAMMDVLRRGDVRITVRYLPQRAINSYASGPDHARYVEGDFILHLAALSAEERLSRVSHTLLGVDFSSRDNLPQIIRSQLQEPLTGAELGVWHGEYSEFLLSNLCLDRFYCIDAWAHLPGRVDITNLPNNALDKVYHSARRRLTPFDATVRILRDTTENAALSIPDESLDFVYIDADHSYEGCLKDLRTYYPKVKRGGILAGHDYIDGHLPEGTFGVRSAVHCFLGDSEPGCLFVSREKWPSWMTIKGYNPTQRNRGGCI